VIPLEFGNFGLVKQVRIGQLLPTQGGSAASVNPERIAITQPRVARNELPWENVNKNFINPERVASKSRVGIAATCSR
jgi:hypothetical protein